MNFEQFLNESINDNGKLKAIIIVGIPGAGKSYTSKSITGTISPRIVNTDVATEFLAKKLDITATSENWSTIFSDRSKQITKESLYHYIDGMLPLIVDGTSSDASNILARAGILESLGYDVGMIYVDTDLETSKRRAIARVKDTNRSVDLDFIERVYSKSLVNKKYFSTKFSFFEIVVNSDDSLTDKVMTAAFKKAQGFFNTELENPVGVDLIDSIKEENKKYMSDVLDSSIIKSKIDNWYKKR